jgi:hypothetical protein
MPHTRWIVLVVSADQPAQSYGPWYDYEKAIKHCDQLRARSRPGLTFQASVVTLHRWPGIKVMMRSLR